METQIIDLIPEELAARWRLTVNTLAVWRSLNKGPSYNKRGGKITYSMADILEYEAKNKIVIGE